MLNKVIDREEQKYYLSNEQYDNLVSMIKDNIVPDNYFKETIYNIYFDNDDYELINRSLEKPLYKEKLRLRSYEKTNMDTLVFLEIKKKLESNSNKRRISIKYQDYLNYINNNVLPDIGQIMEEIDYCFKKYRLKPKVKLRYDRLAYVLKEDNDFRITFDNNIRYSLNSFDFNDIKCDKLFLKDGYIMEIKTFKGIPLWLNKILLNLEIYPTSYSKVGRLFESLKESDIYV